MNPARCCGNCTHFESLGEMQDLLRVPGGRCHGRAPSGGAQRFGGGFASDPFAVVEAVWWCGDFVLRPGVTGGEPVDWEAKRETALRDLEAWRQECQRELTSAVTRLKETPGTVEDRFSSWWTRCWTWVRG